MRIFVTPFNHAVGGEDFANVSTHIQIICFLGEKKKKSKGLVNLGIRLHHQHKKNDEINCLLYKLALNILKLTTYRVGGWTQKKTGILKSSSLSPTTNCQDLQRSNSMLQAVDFFLE